MFNRRDGANTQVGEGIFANTYLVANNNQYIPLITALTSFPNYPHDSKFTQGHKTAVERIDIYGQVMHMNEPQEVWNAAMGVSSFLSEFIRTFGPWTAPYGHANAQEALSAYLRAREGYYFLMDANSAELGRRAAENYVGSFDTHSEFLNHLANQSVKQLRNVPSESKDVLMNSLDYDTMSAWADTNYYHHNNHYFKGQAND